MKIYTKTGDQGETALFGGQRVKKSHPRVVTYGTLDEANSMIGLALSFLPVEADRTRARLSRIQNELFQVGAELATPDASKMKSAKVGAPEIESLEREIDQMETELEPLKSFILPSGSSAGSALHMARTIVRRAERECVDLTQADPLRAEVIQYLNRLSDYLFVAARFVNHHMKKPETKWNPPRA